MRQLKKTPPPVLDDKKKKTSKKSKRSTKKIIAKENKEPTVQEAKMYDSFDASEMLNMSHKDIYQELFKHVLTEKDMRVNNYPSVGYTPRNLVPADCNYRLCARCGVQFELLNEMFVSSTACRYHPKKAIFCPMSQIKAHPCCQKMSGEVGCLEYKCHVTTQHGPKQFTKTASRRHARKDLQHRIFSLDCEMSYTTTGLEVTRIGLVDVDGLTVYDSYVKPKSKILDYNTQYSGVEKRHLEHVTITLDDVKKILNNLIQEDTILVGHALNNDLSALGLIHETVVDTSVLYPHETRPWNKKSLKSLASELLDMAIQNDPSGHDCIDDARACLRLALLKVQSTPPSVPRPLVAIENFVSQQTFIENEDFSYEQQQQQTLMDIQNFSYPPIALAYDMFQQHQEFKKYYYNTPISYYSPYPTLMKRCV